MKERFFIATPQPTDKPVVGEGRDKDGSPASFGIYLNETGQPMKWSGKMPLPKVGDRVNLRINSIGWGEVTGYCEVEDYVGLMVRPDDPPAWYKRQVKEHQKETVLAIKFGPEKAKIERVREHPDWILQGIACVFGSEITLD